MQVVRQLLPDRYEDFVRQYKNDKRKETDSLTYTISDFDKTLFSRVKI